MKAKLSENSVPQTTPGKNQQAERAQRQIHPRRTRVVRLLLSVVALLLLLTLPAAGPRFAPQNPVTSTSFNPVGDLAIVSAPGFDTCVAPPASLLQAWWGTAPYQWLNVYLGGVSMFPKCGGENLTPEWVRMVYEQGWSLLPTWVGPQAPCAAQHSIMSSDSASSYAQGIAEADAAIEAANRLGFPNTAPIYFDMEHFSQTRPDGSRNTACIQAVNTFLQGWNTELTARNHLAGVYASASNYPVLNSSTLTAPAVAWVAGGSLWTQKYDRACRVDNNPYLATTAWNEHQRIYQYTGSHDETYNHQTWNIDSDCADAPMVGHITTTAIVLQFQYP